MVMRSLHHCSCFSVKYLFLELSYFAVIKPLAYPSLCGRIILLFFQDPTVEGEAKIKQEFDELAEEMQQGFRNLED